MKIKRTIAVILCMLMCMSVLAACGKTETAAPASEAPASEAPAQEAAAE